MVVDWFVCCLLVPQVKFPFSLSRNSRIKDRLTSKRQLGSVFSNSGSTKSNHNEGYYLLLQYIVSFLGFLKDIDNNNFTWEKKKVYSYKTKIFTTFFFFLLLLLSYTTTSLFLLEGNFGDYSCTLIYRYPKRYSEYTMSIQYFVLCLCENLYFLEMLLLASPFVLMTWMKCFFLGQLLMNEYKKVCSPFSS